MLRSSAQDTDRAASVAVARLKTDSAELRATLDGLMVAPAADHAGFPWWLLLLAVPMLSDRGRAE